MCHILSSKLKSSEQFAFDYDGSLVIFYKSYNDNIYSEEDMFTENIDPIIYNGVAIIGVNFSFQKELTHLSGPVMMMRGNFTQIN